MELDKLAAALVKLQSLLSPVDKSADNPFFKSKYAPLPEIREALQPLLASCELALVTMPMIKDGANGLHFYLFHSSGQYLDGEWLLTPVQRTPQGEGADTTFKQRYGIMAITGLVADLDDDGNEASAPTAPGRATKSVRTPPRTAATKALEDAKQSLRDAIMTSGAKAEDYAWVASATESDIEKISGLATALSLGKVVPA